MSGGFEDHCWRDVIDDDLRDIYKSYERETFVGEKPAVLAIALYKSAYRGGANPVLQAHRDHPGSCGAPACAAAARAHRALAAARRARTPCAPPPGHARTGPRRPLTGTRLTSRIAGAPRAGPATRTGCGGTSEV